MKDEKTLTIKELEARYEELGAEIEKRKKLEAEKRDAKLAAEKEVRRREIEVTMNKLEHLLKTWSEDYGPFTISSKTNNTMLSYLWRCYF